MPENPPLTREDRSTLLARATTTELTELAETCLAEHPPPRVLAQPEVGCVAVQIREPVAHDEFLLGDVLACRAEVEFAGATGWAMRLGDDRAATLAAALLDAYTHAGGARTAEVDALLRQVSRRQHDAGEAEWRELAPTVVRFEELR